MTTITAVILTSSSLHQDTINTQYQGGTCGYNHTKCSSPLMAKTVTTAVERPPPTYAGDIADSVPGRNAIPKTIEDN